MKPPLHSSTLLLVLLVVLGCCARMIQSTKETKATIEEKTKVETKPEEEKTEDEEQYLSKDPDRLTNLEIVQKTKWASVWSTLKTAGSSFKTIMLLTFTVFAIIDIWNKLKLSIFKSLGVFKDEEEAPGNKLLKQYVDLIDPKKLSHKKEEEPTTEETLWKFITSYWIWLIIVVVLVNVILFLVIGMWRSDKSTGGPMPVLMITSKRKKKGKKRKKKKRGGAN